MKKSLLIAVLFTSLTVLATAQIINSGFENWVPYSTSGENPTGWTTSDSVTQAYFAGSTAFKGSDSYEGTYCLHLKSTQISGLKGPGIATNGLIQLSGLSFVFSGGSPDTARSEVLTGFFKYIPQSDADAAVIKVYKFRYNTATNTRDTIGTGMLLFTDSVSSYTQFMVPIYYRDNNLSPDTSLIIIQSSGDVGTADIAVGSEFIIDSLNFSGFVGIDELNNPISNVNVYPTPASDKITVDVATFKNVTLNYSIYDLSGRLIVSEAMNSLHEVINVNSFAEGNYLLKLSDAENRTLRSVNFLISR